MALLIGFFQSFFLFGAAIGFTFIFFKSDISENSFTTIILRLALGLGTISYATLIFASLHVLNFWVFLAVILTGNTLLILNFRFPGPLRPEFKINLPVVLIGIFSAVNFFYCLFPPTFYDSMLYHLAIPQYYIQHGGIVPWNCNFNSNLPLNGEMLFLFSLLGGTVYIPKLISFFSGIAILILMVNWSKNFISSRFPLLGPMLFYTIPQIGFLSASSKPDMLGMLFLFCANYSFFLHLKKPDKNKKLFLCGIFWGLSISTKYVFAFYYLAFLISVFLVTGASIKKKAATVILISLLVFACMVPWMIKNMLICGNPVYPYFNPIFKSKFWNSEQSENFSTALKRGQETRITDTLIFPIELFIKPYKYGMTAVWGILFLMSLPFLVFSARGIPNRFLIWSSILAFMMLLLFARVPRYFLSSILLLSIPVGSGMENVLGKKIPVRNIIIILLIFVLSIHLLLQINLQESFFQGIHYVKLKVAAGRNAKPVEYLNAIPYYPAVKFINRTLTRQNLIILLGEERTFYLKRPFIACSFADYHPIIRMIRKNTGFGELLRKLHSREVTHILYSESGLQRLGRLSKIYRLSDLQREILDQYLARLQIIYRDLRYTVYRLN